MGFDQLIEKVSQAEVALEAEERRVAAEIHRLKTSWREAWTPGRIVIAGLVTGFMAGRAEPLQNAVRNGSVVRIVSLLSGLFAGTAAQAAAENADEAAESADVAAQAANREAAAPTHARSAAHAQTEQPGA